MSYATLLSRSVHALAACILLLIAEAGYAAGENFRGISIEVIGEGRPVLMIPGLNSGADTWRETCTALQSDGIQCHLVQLPGFAGLPAVQTETFLPEMRDRLLAYIAERDLDDPVVIGHSLGGTLALMMASEQPDAIGRLVIVDALPFYSAIRDPAATAESVRPGAEQMREGMLAADDASYRAQTRAAASGMVHGDDRVKTIEAWGEASDRATTAQAMYELATTDLRDTIAAIRCPVLVLGSWAAYAPYGATMESTADIFRTQYAKLDGMHLEMSKAGYHFLMWDDPKWLQAQVRDFIPHAPNAKE
jgi:pimeloyl-ACP methyl ester carboxylesterase